MLLPPRYDGPPIISLEGELGGIGALMMRQRRRLEGLLGSLTEEQWGTESRCAGWSVRSVVIHLSDTNRFFTFSILAGLAGTPTRLCARFDPVTGPAATVASQQQLTSRDVLAQFSETNTALATAVSGLETAGWNAIAEAPAGHLAIQAVAHHALWDGWVHERDILLPLGLAPTHDEEEVRCCLRYVSAVGPAAALALDSSRSGTLTVEATEPAIQLVVTVDDVVHVAVGTAPGVGAVLRGSAVELIEMLSVRIPLVARLEQRDRWLVEGLATVFDAPVENDVVPS